MKIIPSILVQSEQEFITEINAVQDVLDIVQLDIADGKFVPNTTWADPEVVEKNTNIDIELHLMVKNPLQELTRWTSTEQIKRVLIHYESLNKKSPLEGRASPEALPAARGRGVLSFVREQGWQVGLVLNPDTPIQHIEPHLSELDAVMFMGVYPGFQGQGLVPEVLEKIKTFTSLNPTVFTSIDGAVNEQTLPDIIATGVHAICPGSAIFKNGRNPKENIERIREIINRLTK